MIIPVGHENLRGRRWPWVTTSIILLCSAIFLLTMIQRVFNGPLNPQWAALADLTWRERLIVLPATALLFAIGLFPQLLIGKINSTVIHLVEQIRF